MTVASLLAEQELPAWPDQLGDHLSPSRLGMYLRCPEQFRRRYVLGHKERPSLNLIWGSADDEAHEHNFRQKIDSHADVPADEVKDVFADEFERRLNRDGGVSEVDMGGWEAGKAKDAGVVLVENYHRRVSPRLQPVATQRLLELSVPGVPVPVVGYLDLETESGVVDRKTARAKPSGGMLPGHYRLQGQVYAAATGKPVGFHFAVKTTGLVWTPEDDMPGLLVDAAEGSLALRRIRTLARDLLRTWETFGPDEPWPDAIHRDSPCGWCGFRASCPWWAHERRAA